MRKKKFLATMLAAFMLAGATVSLSACTLPDPHVVFPFLYESTGGNTDTPDDGNTNTPSQGGSTASAMTGYYTSNKVIVWQNMTPVNNYYFMVINAQTIETFEDMTYCLTVNAQMFSNVHYGPDYRNDAEDPDYLATSNEQPHITTKFYGKYTVVESKKSSITISLSEPERVFFAKQGANYCDTANWTDKMSANENGATASEYLASKLTATVTSADGSTETHDLFPADGLSVYIKTTGCTFEALSDFIVTYVW